MTDEIEQEFKCISCNKPVVVEWHSGFECKNSKCEIGTGKGKREPHADPKLKPASIAPDENYPKETNS